MYGGQKAGPALGHVPSTRCPPVEAAQLLLSRVHAHTGFGPDVVGSASRPTGMQGECETDKCSLSDPNVDNSQKGSLSVCTSAKSNSRVFVMRIWLRCTQLLQKHPNTHWASQGGPKRIGYALTQHPKRSVVKIVNKFILVLAHI